MSTPQKEESDQLPQETQHKEPELPHEQQQQFESPENHTQDTEMDEAETNEKSEEKNEEEEKRGEEEGNSEDTKEENVETEATEGKEEEKEKEEKHGDKSEELEVKTPAKAATPVANKTAACASKSAAKRKLEDAATTDHEKVKKTRASVPARAPAAKPSGSTKKVTQAREFSFARPTASSARRTAAVAADHASAKAKPTPPPARKPTQAKDTPAKAQRASMPAPKTPAMDKASRPHFNYTPYTGPLPPLTVESSFAPKNSLALDRGARTASPAKSKLIPAGRKPRPASVKKAQPQSSAGKENNGVNTGGGAATNAASSSKTHRTPIKSSTGSAVSKEETRSAYKEKIKSQRSLAQHSARSISSAAEEDPTA